MKTSNRAYIMSGFLGAIAGLVGAAATGTSLVLSALAGCFVAHSMIWAIWSVASKLHND